MTSGDHHVRLRACIHFFAILLLLVRLFLRKEWICAAETGEACEAVGHPVWRAVLPPLRRVRRSRCRVAVRGSLAAAFLLAAAVSVAAESVLDVREYDDWRAVLAVIVLPRLLIVAPFDMEVAARFQLHPLDARA